jgi:hypothetical protein
VPLKSTGHHNTETGSEEVKEEHMATMKAEEKSGAIFLPFRDVRARMEATKTSGTKWATEQNTVVHFFLFPFLFFY